MTRSGRVAGRLTGVGVGPGDPELITLKGVRVLREADVVFVPVSAGGEPGYAERVVAAQIGPDQARRVLFALGDDPATRHDSWAAAGQAVAEVVEAGGHAAFATIGDPNLYSTFTYLADVVRGLVPEVAIETVPGITALQDLAARSGTVLTEGDQTLALLPFTAGAAVLRRALHGFDTVISYKGGRYLPRVRELLEQEGRLGDAVFGARLGLEGEQVGAVPGAAVAPYLSTVIVARPRGPLGSRLEGGMQ